VALSAARRDLFSYAVVDAYAKSFDQAGYGDSVRAVRDAHAAGDRDGAVAAISDEMVDGIDTLGQLFSWTGQPIPAGASAGSATNDAFLDIVLKPDVQADYYCFGERGLKAQSSVSVLRLRSHGG